MGMTLSEKILARAADLKEVRTGENVTASIDLAMTHESMRGVWPILKDVGVSKVWDPERVVNVFDHYVPPPTVVSAEHQQKIRHALKELGFKPHSRSAIVVDPEDKTHDFFETCTMNAGYNWRVFSDADLASQWLDSVQPAP